MHTVFLVFYSLFSHEESFGKPKWMATDGLDSGVGSEMGLTCKHEFQN